MGIIVPSLVPLLRLISLRELFSRTADEVGQLNPEQQVDRILASIPIGWPARLQEHIPFQFLATELTDHQGFIERQLLRVSRRPLSLERLAQQIPSTKDLKGWIGNRPKSMKRVRAADIRLRNFIRGARSNKTLAEEKIGCLENFRKELGPIIEERHGIRQPSIVQITRDNPLFNSPEFLSVIIEQEKVHPIGIVGQGNEDLFRRLGWEGLGSENRALYAMLDPMDPKGIMMSIQAAFFDREKLPGDLGDVLRGTNPTNGLVDSVAFYSISTGEKTAYSFSADFIRALAAKIVQEKPGVKYFYTLSPMRQFRTWVGKLDQDAWQKLGDIDGMGMSFNQFKNELGSVFSSRELRKNLNLFDCMQRLSFVYLTGGTTTDGKFRGYDGVAGGVHLAGGAEIERVNPEGSDFDHMWQESYGFMVNYCYRVFHNGAFTTIILEDNKALYESGITPLSQSMADYAGRMNARAPSNTNYRIRNHAKRLAA